ncbi:hypothetical protein JCM19233_4782 [Vibrio astriarenae]|nr:hypothetical protein JCM19233_4782 [Vibrio sp. C7]
MQITECDTGVVHQCTPGCRIKLPSFLHIVSYTMNIEQL